MSFPELPPLAGDTEPITSPTRPTVPKRPRPSRSQSFFLGVMVVSAISLIATVVWLFTARIATNPPNTVAVTIIYAGEAKTVNTLINTSVAEVLATAQISLMPEDAISLDVDNLITEAVVIHIAQARNVTITINNQQATIRTPLENPADILRNQAIVLNQHDRIWIDGTEVNLNDLVFWLLPTNEIVIRRPVTITIVDGDEPIQIDTFAVSVGDALYEANIAVYLTDTVTPDSSTPIEANMTVTIDRARSVSIIVDGTTLETRVRGLTVADALTEAGVALVGLDYVIPAEDEVITPDMMIHVLRVTEQIDTYDEAIPYETIYEADANLALDELQVRQSGQRGIVRYSERVRYENGVEVGREPATMEVVSVSVNQVVAYGTQIVLRTIETPEGTREYWRVLRMYATSYHPEALGGDDRTSIGETLRHGIIAANPNIIPYRTQVFVPNYGVGMIADTGGPRSSPYWIDLGYSDEDYRGWHQYVDVYLLTPVPANIQYRLPNWSQMRGIADD